MGKLIESSKALSRPGAPFGEVFAGEWVSLHVRLPGCDPRPIGIMVWESGGTRCRVELDENWLADRAEEEDAAIWVELAADLEQRACEMGPAFFIEWLENSASHAFFIGPRQSVCVPVIHAVARELYRHHVQRAHHDLKTAKKPAQRLRALFPLKMPAWKSVAKPSRWTFACGGAVAALFLIGLTMNYKSDESVRETVHFATSKDTNVPASRGLEVFPPQVSLSTLPNLFLPSARSVPKKAGLGQTPTAARKRLNPAELRAHARPRVVYVAACPLQTLPATNSVDTLPVVLPAPPRYRNRDNHLVHFFSRLASPVKKLIVQD